MNKNTKRVFFKLSLFYSIGSRALMKCANECGNRAFFNNTKDENRKQTDQLEGKKQGKSLNMLIISKSLHFLDKPKTF